MPNHRKTPENDHEVATFQTRRPWWVALAERLEVLGPAAGLLATIYFLLSSCVGEDPIREQSTRGIAGAMLASVGGLLIRVAAFSAVRIWEHRRTHNVSETFHDPR